MRVRHYVVLCCAISAIAVGCGASEGLTPRDSAMAPDGADARDAAADATGDRPGDGGATTDARDAAIDATGDVVSDAAQDVPADLGAADAVDGAEAGGDAAPDAGPSLVTLQFSGTVQTVAGTPLGLDSTARLAPVSGTFAYDLNVADSKPTDPQRGRYLHNGSSQFTFTVSGHVVTGSGLAIVETEDLNPDTFRFRDGQQNDTVVRTMKLDGTGVPALVLLITITDSSGAALSSDVEPNPFPFVDTAGPLAIANIPHTFSLMDAGGTLLMQLTSLVQQ